MVQEEQPLRYTNSSSSGGCNVNGRSSKKLKQKKVPQRGLGVAQLEKIRLEEQQKRESVFQVANAIISPSNSSSCLAANTTNFRHDVSSLPLTDQPSPNQIFRSPPTIPNSIDVIRPNSISMSVPNNGVMGWQDISSAGRGGLLKLWNDEYNLEGEINYKLDHKGSNVFCSSVNLPCESANPVRPLPAIAPRSQQFQEPCPSSMVNVPLGTSSSSFVNFQIEPPSNQSFRSNSTPLWPEEERDVAQMVGMKRSYPFSIDDAPVPSFNCRFPPTYVPRIPGTNELASSFSNDGTFNFEQHIPVLREGPSGSNGTSESNKKKFIKENGGFNGDFLTLAPPKPKHPSPYIGHYNQEVPDFDALPYQGASEDPVPWPGLIRPVEQPFFSFLPSAQNGQSTLSISSSNDGVVENVDLNLKL